MIGSGQTELLYILCISVTKSNRSDTSFCSYSDVHQSKTEYQKKKRKNVGQGSIHQLLIRFGYESGTLNGERMFKMGNYIFCFPGPQQCCMLV